MTAPSWKPLTAAIAFGGVVSSFSVAYAAPTAIVKNQDFSFGRFTTGTGTGTVTVNTAGGRVSSGSVILLNGDVVTAAQFTITGNAGKLYTLTVPTTFTVTSGSYQMTVSGITASVATTGAIPTSGSLTFTVGGTMNVGGSQHNGAYTGSLNLSVK